MVETALVVDEAKIKKAVNGGIPLTLISYTLPHEMSVYIGQVLSCFLESSGHGQLKDYLVYCVQELAVNAKKANTKRAYFLERKLDLENVDEYSEGMLRFRKDTHERLEHFLQKQKDLGFYIKVILLCTKDAIIIEVRNNAIISKIELMRIHEKLARSRQYDSLEDAFTQVLDDSEGGAGLGLVVLVLMLKKMGLDEECFEILATEIETLARLKIPFDKRKTENVTKLTNVIVQQVKSLPQFPENVVTVQRLASDPNSEMADIARRISIDPAMLADILKIVNSAQYMMVKRVDSIAEAVKILGIKGIKNLLYSYGTYKILGEDTDEKKILWRHCYRAGFYAYNLVRNFGRDKTILDDAYVGGILHDMGKIVFFAGIPGFPGSIRAFCVEKNIPEIVFEDVSAGMNHAEIGALIAEKWNFPPMLVASIRFHHEPLAAPLNFRPLVEAIYLGNMLCEFEEGSVTFEQFEPSVLRNFGLASKKQTEAVVRRFSEGFSKGIADI